VSTLGDTIERVLFYDPKQDRFIRAPRGSSTFTQMMYNRSASVLLLRLTLRTKPRGRYVLRRELQSRSDPEGLVGLLTDREPSNVEVRKSRARADTVEINRYYRSTTTEINDAIDVPRDGIGSLWDRLEQNRISAWLFHWFVRTFAYHVELFMSPGEFAAFWKIHRELPIKKIQLRCVRRDGLPHSPMRDGDRISADLIMWRWQRDVFLKAVRAAMPEVRFNPGKQSL
jgi:hypothetical protein